MKKLALLLAVLVVGTTIGFFVGARVGVHEFMLADAQYKASILAYQLRALRANKPDSVLVAMEIALDSELANHGEYMESHFSWLWPQLKSKDDHAIRNAVAYRLANPYERPDVSTPINLDPNSDAARAFLADMAEGQQLMNHYIEKVLTLYGDMPHNPSLQPTPQRGAAD